MQAVILAAGKGDRLKPLTNYRSKAMLPVLGTPMIQKVIEQFDVPAIEDFILVVSPEDHEIQNYYKSISISNKRIRLVFQQKPIGTANALLCAAPFIKEDFLLSSCDNLTSRDYIIHMLEFWNSAPALNALLTLKLIDTEDQSSLAIVTLENDLVTRIIEKPRKDDIQSKIASLPLFCFNLSILDYLNDLIPSQRGEFELQEGIQRMIDDNNNVMGLWIDQRLHLTVAKDLLKINLANFSNSSFKNLILTNQIGVRTKIIPPVLIESGTQIGRECRIGPKVFIEEGCSIGSGSEIQNALILRPSKVNTGSKIKDEVFYLE